MSTIPELLPISHPLQCKFPVSGETPCSPELRAVCKPHNAVSILGVDVISEARVLEVYSDMDGYLFSCKGERTTGNVDNEKVYDCRFRLEEPVTSITIKFLGLDDKVSFSMQRLHFALVERSNRARGQSDTGIDLDKVKGYLHSMGGVMSENAQDLLNSVEKYQQSQMLGMSSLQSAISGTTSQTGPLAGIGQLTGLLSMFSKFSSVGMATQGQQNKTNHQNNDDQHQSELDKNSQTKNDTLLLKDQSPKSEQINHRSLENPSQGNDSGGGKCDEPKLSPLERLLRKPLTSEGHTCEGGGHDRVEGQDDMYKMLQGICGSVSALRLKPLQEEESGNSQEQKDYRQNGTENLHGDSPKPSQTNIPLDMNGLTKVIEQTVLQEVHQCEARIKDYIDTSLVSMETRMNAKLDKILKLLEKSCDIPSCDSQ